MAGMTVGIISLGRCKATTIIFDECYDFGIDVNTMLIEEAFEMNPDFRPCIYYPEKDWLKEERLKESQSYKRSNQKHPAFKKRK